MSNSILFKNTKISFNQIGQGKPIILLHGFLSNSMMWNSLIPKISAKNCIVTIDLLGHGKSECFGYIHTIELMAEAVFSVLEHLNIKKATLIGHSMGGYVALAFAELYPKMVQGLCLVNSTSQEDSSERMQLRSRAIEAVKTNYESIVRQSISNLFRPKNRVLFSKEIKGLKKEALKTPIQGYIAAQEGMKIRKNREVILHSGLFKKMMIMSKKDPVLNYDSLIKEVQNIDIIIAKLPDGHMSYIENNEAFSYNIVHFIENI